MCTAKGKQLRAHVESKHDKTDPLQCFPGLLDMEAAEEAAAASVKVKAAPAPAKKVNKAEDDLSKLLSEGLKVKK